MNKKEEYAKVQISTYKGRGSVDWIMPDELQLPIENEDDEEKNPQFEW